MLQVLQFLDVPSAVKTRDASRTSGTFQVPSVHSSRYRNALQCLTYTNQYEVLPGACMAVMWKLGATACSHQLLVILVNRLHPHPP